MGSGGCSDTSYTSRCIASPRGGDTPRVSRIEGRWNLIRPPSASSISRRCCANSASESATPRCRHGPGWVQKG